MAAEPHTLTPAEISAINDELLDMINDGMLTTELNPDGEVVFVLTAAGEAHARDLEATRD